MAYYSDQGTTIMQGVGNLGEFFEADDASTPRSYTDGSLGEFFEADDASTPRSYTDGSLGEFFEADDASTPRSFTDGSLGEFFSADSISVPRPERYAMPGELQAYQDGMFGRYMPGSSESGAEEAFEGGIFHALGLPLFIDGKQVDGPLSITHGNPAESVAPVSENAGPGLHSSTSELGIPEGNARSFNDGILGPMYADVETGGLVAYDQGVLGAVDVFVIDMKDPQWVKELKAALVMSLAGMGIVEPINVLSDEFYASPYWDGRSSGMVRDWAETYQSKINQQASKGLLMLDNGNVAVPTVTGIGAIIQTGVGIQPATFTPANFPKLYAFQQEVVKIGSAGTLDSFRLILPYASEAEKIRQAGGIMNMSNLSLWLLGGVGAVAIGFIGYNLLRK
jgi:hypothetical protein